MNAVVSIATSPVVFPTMLARGPRITGFFHDY